MFEKEGFAIFHFFEKFDYFLISRNPAHAFTGYRNHLFMYALLALEPALGWQLLSEMQRWAIFLSTYTYFIEHIEKEHKCFADILTKFAMECRNEIYKLKTFLQSFGADCRRDGPFSRKGRMT